MTKNLEQRLRNAIIDVPDFPKPGILFKDITPVLHDPALRADIIEAFRERYCERGVTAVAGPESRGFLFGVLLASELGVPFVPIRKPGKLPRPTYSQSYELEYGTDELHIHQDAVTANDNVVIVDDLLATGGTALASWQLIEKAGARVEEASFVIGLAALKGRRAMGKRAVYSLTTY